MAITAQDALVVQQFKKSASDATTVTLVPSTAAYGESKPTHLASTQIVLTYTALPENLWGTIGATGVADDREYRITIERVG